MQTRPLLACVLGLAALGTAITPVALECQRTTPAQRKGEARAGPVQRTRRARQRRDILRRRQDAGHRRRGRDDQGLGRPDGEERSTIKRFSTQVTKRPAVPVTLAVSPDGATLATSLGDDVPRLWNTDTGRERTVLRREPEAGLVMTFSPSGRLLAFRGPSGTVDFWNVDTEPDEQRGRVPPHEVGRIEVKEPEPGPRVVSCCPLDDLLPGRQDPGGGRAGPDRRAPGDGHRTRSWPGSRTCVLKVESKDQNETRLHPLTEEQLRALGVSRPFTFDDVGLAFSPDGKTLALGGPEITLWDVRTGKKTGTLPARAPEGFARLAFSADGKTLTSASPASAPFALKGANVKELWTGEPKKGDDFVGVRVRRWDLGTGRETAAAVIRVYDGDQPNREWQPDLRPGRLRRPVAGPDDDGRGRPGQLGPGVGRGRRPAAGANETGPQAAPVKTYRGGFVRNG